MQHDNTGLCPTAPPENIMPMPRIAYVLLWYPLFTQPFIFREVEGLKKLMPLKVYSLYALNLRQCSEEMRAAASETQAFGSRHVFAFLGEFFRQCFSHPRRTWHLFKRSVCRRWSSLEILGENLWAFLAGLYLAKVFARDGIEQIHAPWPRGTATAAWVASSLTGIPFSTLARADNLSPADPDFLDKLEAAAFIRTNNAADKERMIAMMPDQEAARRKVHLIYNSLTLPVMGRCPVQMPSPVRLLALGRFDVTKGFEYLLEACFLLKQQNIAFTLTLAGGGGAIMGLGNLGSKLEKMRQDFGLESQIVMPGLVTHSELPRLLMEHDIFVAPCVIHDDGRRDGIPNVAIEAMAYGMPIVATAVNGLPEIVLDGETGLLVEQKNPEALAEAVKRFVADPDAARRMGANAASLIKTMFDPQTNTGRLCDLYQEQHHLLRGKTCAV